MDTAQKTHKYKVYRNSQFLGVLPKVLSDFRYHQQLGTAGAELNIVVQAAFDSSDVEVEPLLTEAGEVITDESGEPIYTERAVDLFGDANPNALIRNENDIEVWEYSEENPAGIIVFKGFISTWRVSLGSEDKVIAKVLSHGEDMDDYLVQVGGYTPDTEVVFTSNTTIGFGNSTDNTNREIVQEFEFLTSGNFGRIDLKLGAWPSNGLTAVFKFGRGTHDNQIEILYETTRLIPRASNSPLGAEDISFSFDAIPVVAGEPYFFEINNIVPGPGIENNITILVKDANPYGAGKFWAWRNNVGWYEYLVDGTTVDAWFKTYMYGGLVVADFLLTDPADMVREIIDDYRSRGGLVSYTPTSIEDTGVLRDYNYRVNTVLESVQKATSLAPSDWNWYVDPATNILHFKQTPATATHTFTFKKEIHELVLEQTSENIVNVVYFTGGKVSADENLFAKFTNSDSLSDHRIGMARVADNRVVEYDIADDLSDNVLDANAEPAYRTSVIISAARYDISTINLGETVGFRGFGSVVDDLVLIIVGIEVTPDWIKLDLGSVKPRTTAVLESVKRQLEAEQTVDNPDEPL